MKTLNLTKTEINGKQVTTAQLILDCLNVAPAGGFTREDFKKRDRIEVVFTDIYTASVDLEDQDYEALKAIIDGMKWTMRSPVISHLVAQF